MEQKQILSSHHMDVTLHRLACQLAENHIDFSKTALIGIQSGGVILVQRLKEILEKEYGIKDIKHGLLDITFFRDDFRRGEAFKANKTQIDFIVEDMNVIFVDDVLYTGRSIRAALTALTSFGRPKQVELCVLIDRRFSRNLPIQPDYSGKRVDTFNTERVEVAWKENEGEDGVFIVRA